MAQVHVRLSDALSQCYGTGDFAEWIRKLERVAKLQNIDELADFVPLFLTGGAYAVYEGIPEKEKESYEKVKAALLSAFSPNRFDAYEEFSSRRLGDGESVDVFFADLQRLAGLVKDDWLKCAFVAGLPEHVRKQLRSSCVLASMQVAELLEKSRGVVKASGTAGAREACFAASRDARRPVERSVICFLCGGPGHTSRYCQTRRVAKGSRNCYVCGDSSHLAARCPHRKDEGQQPKNE